ALTGAADCIVFKPISRSANRPPTGWVCKLHCVPSCRRPGGTDSTAISPRCFESAIRRPVPTCCTTCISASKRRRKLRIWICSGLYWAFPTTRKPNRSMIMRRSRRYASRLPRRRRTKLVLGKIRLSLLEKGANSLDAILRLQTHLLRAALGAQLLLQRIIEGRCVQGANLPEHRARTRREPVRHRLGPAYQLVSRCHRIGQTPLERGLGGDSLRQH